MKSVLLNKEWWAETAERGVKTFCQVFIGFLLVGGVGGTLGFADVDWATAASVSGVATIASVAMRVSTAGKEEKEIVLVERVPSEPVKVKELTAEEIAQRIEQS